MLRIQDEFVTKSNNKCKLLILLHFILYIILKNLSNASLPRNGYPLCSFGEGQARMIGKGRIQSTYIALCTFIGKYPLFRNRSSRRHGST